MRFCLRYYEIVTERRVVFTIGVFWFFLLAILTLFRITVEDRFKYILEIAATTFRVRKRYSGEILKTIRNFKKVDYKFGKAKLDIDFLIKCQRENVIPNFLQFRLTNKDLRNSVTYIKCQQNLLQTEIKNKKSHQRTLQNEFNRLGNDLQFSLNCIDFAHISAIFLSSNDNLLKTQKTL